MVERRAARPIPSPAEPNVPQGTLDQSRIRDRVAPFPIGSGVTIIDAIAALDPPAADRYIYFTSASAGALGVITSFARSILDDADEAAFKATVNLEIGTDVQAYSANLDGWAGVAVADYYTSAQVDAGFQPLDSDLTAIAALSTQSFGRALLTSQGQITRAVRRITAAGDVTVSATTDDIIVIVKDTPAATAVNLPASPTAGGNYTIKDGGRNCSTYNITITPDSENIEGAATYVMNVDGQSVVIVYDGNEYLII